MAINGTYEDVCAAGQEIHQKSQQLFMNVVLQTICKFGP